ncbi:MAG TPA: universal stress protein [Holophagaceae bacterium]|nr:universal stress protein [Holophagaceae bacterium]
MAEMEVERVPRRVIVGIDFSEPSRRALEAAAALARETGAPLMAMHVIEPPPPFPSEAELPLLDPAWTQAMAREAEGKLDAWLGPFATWLSAYAGASAKVVWGRPAARLVEEAGPGDLLVLGPSGASAARRLLLGSTSTAVARHARCDVLLSRGESAS